MSRNNKYQLNPETLIYEVKKGSKKLLAAKTFMLFLGSLALAGLYFWLYVSVFDLELPKTSLLKKKNADWLTKMEMMNRNLDVYEEALSGIEMNDEDVYRAIFGMSGIPDEIREEGFGGVNRYQALEGTDHSGQLKVTVERLDRLTKKAYIQSKSFDEVEIMAKHAGDMASCIPAIPPMIPDKSKYHLSSTFGYRSDPLRKYRTMHTGVDFSMKPGNNVYATGDGVVAQVKYELFGYGNWIIIDHGFGYKTRYAHLKVITVAQGMKVKRGECIGESGNSGKSTGPHLHYEVMYKDNYVNPMSYVDLDMPVDEYKQLVSQVEGESGRNFIHPSHIKNSSKKK